ncbi:hypothetical protein M2152_002517 [Microbacteriaceae bacterium SG_E_30_P1]|uniref:DUF2339 domain-containing protein n=1 Tax=Antiquaquibacter oligotrophicus TaxID=2880260 RepID=A0ABT6KRC7_9MICO|nr:hypothetical protein [Antiquaquibacter oligotrophicus]MDH6182335.1 hypothetical protein [Antiquaquibacter oligotrophicus]UDF12012.1 hypothetical protein LH407_07475 [Antiquaquibacter oligotrophicus]
MTVTSEQSPPAEETSTGPRPNGGRRALIAARDTVVLFIRHVIVEPVREGRLRDVGWPRGLRPIVFVALVGYAVAVALVLGSSLIRAGSDLFLQSGDATPLPRSVMWVTMSLTALALALGRAGALHARAWARWLVTAFTVLVLLLASVPDLAAIPVGRIVAVAASIAIVVLVAVRGRRAFAWWEFVVISGVVFGSIVTSIAVISAASRPLGFDFVPIMVSLVLITIGQLAIPAAIASGAAVAELAVSSAVWAAGVTRDRLGRTAVIVLLVAIVIWRIVDLAPTARNLITDPAFEAVTLVGALVFLVVLAAVWVLIARLRGRASEETTTSGMITLLAGVSLLVAAFLTLTIPASFVQLAGLVVRSFGAGSWVEPFIGVASALSVNPLVIGGTRFAAGVALIVIAIVIARRGRAVLPELLVSLGLANAAAGVCGMLGIALVWSADSLASVATLGALGLLVWMLVARRVTTPGLAAIAAALLIAALFTHRDVLADPLAALIGSTATAAVLLGFVWALLTGTGVANETSAAYPRPARVMLVLGNALFGATVLAYTSLARDPDSTVNLARFAEYGAQGFGDALIAASLLVAFRASIRGAELS